MVELRLYRPLFFERVLLGVGKAIWKKMMSIGRSGESNPNRTNLRYYLTHRGTLPLGFFAPFRRVDLRVLGI